MRIASKTHEQLDFQLLHGKDAVDAVSTVNHVLGGMAVKEDNGVESHYSQTAAARNVRDVSQPANWLRQPASTR